MNKSSDLEHLVDLEKRLFLVENPRVMVAMSGGVDSTVLFDVLLRLKKRKKILELSICHVNFGLRNKESDLDQRFIEVLANRSQIEGFFHQVSKSEREKCGKRNIQLWARNYRYQIFERYKEEGWVIALAHHQDDLAENIILRLARGTSVRNLSGMSSWNPPYWRPLLSLSKVELINWSNRHNLQHREDSTNAKMDYSRNVIRHKILPELETLFPGAAKRIARVGTEAKEIGEFANKKANEQLGICEGKTQFIDIEKLMNLPKSVVRDQIGSLIYPLIHRGSEEFSTLKKAVIDSSFIDHVLEKIIKWSRDNEKSFHWSAQVSGGGLVFIKNGIVGIRENQKTVSKHTNFVGKTDYLKKIEKDGHFEPTLNIT